MDKNELQEKERIEKNIIQAKVMFSDYQKNIDQLSSLVSRISYHHGKYAQNQILKVAGKVKDEDYDSNKEILELKGALHEAKKVLEEIIGKYS
jgi:hypothetical protein